MPCEQLGSVIVCRARTTRKAKLRRRCPTCRCRSTIYAFFEDWYGWTMTCIRCGESWQDVERLPRPFERGWRQRSIAWAKKRWAQPLMPSLWEPTDANY